MPPDRPADGQPLALAVSRALEGDPARPALVHQDVAAGTRVELSVASLRNGVAKVTGLLAADPPGARIALDLPPHWITGTLLLGCWLRGVVPLLAPSEAELAEAALAVLGPDSDLGRDLPDRAYVSRLHPFALPFPAQHPLPWQVEDLAPAWRSGPDAPLPAVALGPDAPALMVGAAGATGLELMAAAQPDLTGHAEGEPWDSVEAVAAAVLAPLLAGRTAVVVTGLTTPPSPKPPRPPAR